MTLIVIKEVISLLNKPSHKGGNFKPDRVIIWNGIIVVIFWAVFC